MYDWPKYYRVRIPVSLDPDLFKQIRILERTMTVHAMILSLAVRSENLILHL
jgi:hypothetical protein